MSHTPPFPGVEEVTMISAKGQDMEIFKVILARHPERQRVDGKSIDAITPYGMMQMAAAFEQLVQMGLVSDATDIYTSGKKRTVQAGLVCQLTRGNFGGEDTLEQYDGLSDATFHAYWGDDVDTFFEARDSLIGELGRELTVKDALEADGSLGGYARDARDQVTAAVIWLAQQLNHVGEEALLGISHGTWLEMAAVDPAKVAYGIAEATAVVYTVEFDLGSGTYKIVGTEVVDPPLPGKAN